LTVRRTRAFIAASRLASAKMSLVASPSSDPTAIVSVVGRSTNRYERKPAPAIRMKALATRTIRNQAGNVHPGDTIHAASTRSVRRPPYRAEVQPSIVHR